MKFPKPWYRPNRGVWYLTIEGTQHNLGPDKEDAIRQYVALTAQPRPKESRRGFCRLRHRRLSRLVPEAPCPDDLRVVSLPAATLQLFGKRPAEHVRAWRGLAGGEVDAGNASHRDSGAQDHARPYAGRGDYVKPRLLG
jgi:hypothetical protein